MSGHLDSSEFRNALVADDDAAWTLLIETTRDDLRATARRAGARGASIDEALVETFFQAWQMRERIREVQKMSPWLCQVTRRAALAPMRKRARRERLDRDRMATLTLQHACGAEIRDREEEAAQLLAGLPEHEVEVMWWRFLKGKSTSEIAEMLGISDRAVRKRLSSALERLDRRGRAGDA